MRHLITTWQQLIQRLHLTSKQDLLWHYLQVDMERENDRNAFYLIVEIFWATFLSAAAAFNSAYALRLGASDQSISFLTSFPALIAVIVSFPAARILRNSSNKKRLLMNSLFLTRLAYVLVALAPWFKFLPINPGVLVVIFLILGAIPGQLFNIGFIPLQAEAVSEESQSAVISLRNQIFSAAHSICVFLFGLWLDAVIFPLNYQLMYLVTFAITLLSSFYLAKVSWPRQKTEEELRGEAEKKALQKKEKRSMGERLRRASASIKEQPDFIRFTVNTMVMDGGFWIVAPLFTILYVNELGATDSWLGASASIGSITTVVGFSIWRKIMGRWGTHKTLTVSAFIRISGPVFAAFYPNLTAILIWSGVFGLLIPGLSLSHYRTFLRATPAENREDYIALYSFINNISIVILPLIGMAVSELIGIQTTLILSIGVRLIGALMWVIFPIKDYEKEVIESAAA
ncbi:MAG: MFS transporter [Anaerolineaceae bacterium]|nr:MFS transporter [Anaerolineaceae bacterium]